nr:hypothetical protein [Thermoactinospora rubra]
MQGSAYVSEHGRHGGDLLLREPFGDGTDQLIQAHLLDLPLGFRLGDPPGDHRRIAPRIHEGSIGGELAFARGHRLASSLDRHQAMVIGQLCLRHGADRVREMRGIEHRGQPRIQRLDDQLFPDVDRARVVELVGLRVLAGEDAPVVRLAVVPAALHAPLADTAEQQAAEDVRPRRPAGLATFLGASVLGATVVLSSVRPRSKSTVDLDELSGYFRDRCRAVVSIPYDPHLEEDSELDLDRLAKETRDAYLMLAATVGDTFGGSHRRQPAA